MAAISYRARSYVSTYLLPDHPSAQEGWRVGHFRFPTIDEVHEFNKASKRAIIGLEVNARCCRQPANAYYKDGRVYDRRTGNMLLDEHGRAYKKNSVTRQK
jgi:hypothetical protein